MATDKPSGGRTKNMVSGGGNANKRGEGLGTGPVGDASRGSAAPSGKDGGNKIGKGDKGK